MTSYGTADPRRRGAGGVALPPARARRGAAGEEQPLRAARAVRLIRADHRLALTGTPVENRLAELWSIMDAVNPGLLGTVTAFRDRYAVPIERHGRSDVAERLQTAVPPVPAAPGQDRPQRRRRPPRQDRDRRALHADRGAGLALPGGRRRDDRVAARPRDRRQGHRAAGQGARRDDQAQAGLRPPGAAAARRLADRAGGPGKLARGRGDRRRDPGAGEKVLLLHPVHRVRRHARAAPVGPVRRRGARGCTAARPRGRRDRMVEAFQAEDGAGRRSFLLSLKAGGTGLTLTAAKHVVHLDRWWNPAVEDQATDRAFRIGQKRTVQVRKLVCSGTVEERIDDMIAGKRGARRPGHRRRRRRPRLAHRPVHRRAAPHGRPRPGRRRRTTDDRRARRRGPGRRCRRDAAARSPFREKFAEPDPSRSPVRGVRQADRRRRRAHREEQARGDRGVVVVGALPRGPRAARGRRPAHPREDLRPARAGGRR